MCRMCEGFSLEDTLALTAARIAEHGFAIQAVGDPAGADDDALSWAYTVGLLDAAGHPEMIVAGVSARVSGPLLSGLGRQALDGERFQPGETIDLEVGIALVGTVDDVQYELSTFNTWHNLRDAGVLQATELAAVQIIVPSVLCPFGDRSWQPVLSDHHARVG